MSLEQYSTTRDTINAIHSRLQAAHRQFAGALVRVAIVPDKSGLRFLTGTMVFAEEKLGGHILAEYQIVRLVEFWIDGQDNAANYLSRLWSGQEHISSIPILNTFNHSRVDYNSSGDTPSGWPSWLFAAHADARDGEPQLSLEQQPAVSKGLPPYRSPADAVRSWIFQERPDSMTIGVPYQEHFLVVIPDTRARFVSGRWTPGKLDLSIEVNTAEHDLELQIIHVGSEKCSSNYPVTVGPMALEIPEDARELILYVVHKNGDLVCSHSLQGLYRSFGRFEHRVDDGTEYAQALQAGENEVREFKSFITPKDKKESELVKTIVAFANTDGGTVFLGVDDEGVPLGIAAARQCFKKAPDPIDAQRARLKSLITESTKPVPSVVCKTVEVNGSPIVIAEVKKSPSVCSTHDNRIYVRRGATSRLADPRTELPALLSMPVFDLQS